MKKPEPEILLTRVLSSPAHLHGQHFAPKQNLKRAGKHNRNSRSKNPKELRSVLHSARRTTLATPDSSGTPGHKTGGYNGFKGKGGGNMGRNQPSGPKQCINTYTDKRKRGRKQ